ncbi:MAG: hypothetical protein RR576_11930, partial [Oscillospiraceae bacterium]
KNLFAHIDQMLHQSIWQTEAHNIPIGFNSPRAKSTITAYIKILHTTMAIQCEYISSDTRKTPSLYPPYSFEKAE